MTPGSIIKYLHKTETTESWPQGKVLFVNGEKVKVLQLDTGIETEYELEHVR